MLDHQLGMPDQAPQGTLQTTTNAQLRHVCIFTLRLQKMQCQLHRIVPTKYPQLKLHRGRILPLLFCSMFFSLNSSSRRSDRCSSNTLQPKYSSNLSKYSVSKVFLLSESHFRMQRNHHITNAPRKSSRCWVAKIEIERGNGCSALR